MQQKNIYVTTAETSCLPVILNVISHFLVVHSCPDKSNEVGEGEGGNLVMANEILRNK